MSFLTAAERAAIAARSEGNVHTRKGQAGQWSRLADEKVSEIRALSARGLSQYKIAVQIGCTQPAVSMILSGKRRAR